MHLASAIGPARVRVEARSRLEAGTSSVISVLGRLQDMEGLNSHAMRIAAGEAPVTDLDLLVDAMDWLDSAALKDLMGTIVETLPHEAYRILGLAANERFAAEPLVSAAEALIRNPNGGYARIGLRYLARLEPDLAWRLVTAPEFIDWMARADAFDWVGVSQELPSATAADQPEAAAVKLAKARTVLSAFEDGGFAREDVDSGQMAIGRSIVILSHVLANLAGSGNTAAALEALSGVQLDTVDTLGKVPNPKETMRAYITWLAAKPAEQERLDCLPEVWLGAERLVDSDPLTVRAAATLILAQPQLVLLPTCSVPG